MKKRLALAAAAATVVSGVYLALPSPSTVVPIYRFADATWRARLETNAPSANLPSDMALDDPRTGAYPIVSLLDEAQYVLNAPPRDAIHYAERLAVPANGRLSLTPGLTPPLAGAGRLAITTQVKHGGVWRRMADTVASVKRASGKEWIEVDVVLPSETADGEVGLHIDATVIQPDRVLFNRTLPVAIPSNAYLAFAIGIRRLAWEQGPVEFSVTACEGHDCAQLFRRTLDPAQASDRGWQNQRIALDALAGRTVSLRFETKLLSEAADAFTLPAWGNPTVYAADAEVRTRPNIILMSIDTLAAKHLPTYGYPFDTAPFLHELAMGGTVFDRCVAAATTTPQSHMSMLTSVQPCVHGIITGMERLPPTLLTLAEVLRAANYETGAVTEDGWLGYQHGFGRGFNAYTENKSADIMAPEGQVDVTLRKARDWIARNHDKAFFLFLHTFQVHDPYRPPPAYQTLFRNRDGVEVTDDSTRPLREIVAYDQEIRYTDDELRSFFDFLEKSGLLDDTVIILTSDHGEEFFEHGLWGHGADFFEEVTRVPLLFWGPDHVAAGRRSEATVGHIDLMPTILKLAGVTAPPQVAGRDLLDVEADGGTASEPRFCESRVTLAVGADYLPFDVTPPAFLIQDGPHKLSRFRDGAGFRYEYFDLASDPDERRNAFDRSLAAQRLREPLDGYEAACAAAVAENAAVVESEVTLDPASEEKLRALGYLK